MSVRFVSANSPPVLSNATEAGVLVVDVNEGVLEVVTLVASDDDGDVVTFSLYQDENETKDSEFFELNASSGILSFVDAPSYEVPDDFDGNNVYAFTILYTDGNTSTISAEVRRFGLTFEYILFFINDISRRRRSFERRRVPSRKRDNSYSHTFGWLYLFRMDWRCVR